MAPTYEQVGVAGSVIETYEVGGVEGSRWMGGVGKTDGSGVQMYMDKGSSREVFRSEQEVLDAMRADRVKVGKKLSVDPTVVGYREPHSHGSAVSK